MRSFEPFWNPRTESWPGTRNEYGRLRKADVLYDTHLGAWCDWNAPEGLGVVPTDEFQFAPDGTFH